ncbi:hypothetical protein GWI33_003770 [Rhynchophorus ferrugineus]|uniref:RNase H type-1 domain-containing protein n=1 Tax=Rhynchophorus ferrugineus TaxID=354439 RepID=A0A834IQS1_RHYFE|nr:hypothetical protein GWI33_003770 [Rhynchophorus ferrugineus]
MRFTQRDLKTMNIQKLHIAYITLKEEHYKLPPLTSVFTAELLAIYKAFKCVQDSPNRISAVIITDFMSSLESLKSAQAYHSLTMHIRELNTAARNRGKNITYMWLSSHMGIEGNERADHLAGKREGSLLEDYLYWRKDLNTYHTALYKKLDQLNWDLMTNNNCASRRKLDIFSKLRIGHCRLTHEFLPKVESSPICDRCRSPLSIKHILIECQGHGHQRRLSDLKGYMKQLLQLMNLEQLMNYLAIGVLQNI